MAGRQVRVEAAVVTLIEGHREELGLPSDAGLGEAISALARDGAHARLERRRRAERLATYAEWGQDEELRREVRDSVRAAIEAGIV